MEKEYNSHKHDSSPPSRKGSSCAMEIKCLGDQWKTEYGLPFTKDRLKKHKNEPLTIGIFRIVESINECERIRELINRDE